MKLNAFLLAVILSLTSLSAFAEVVNLNKADAGAFQHYLKGIGEKKAKDIVAYRKDHKSFKTVDEIMEVKGIGEGIFKKIKMDLSLTKGVTSAPAKKVAKKQDKSETAKKADAKKTADAPKVAKSKTAKLKKEAKTKVKESAKKS